jgi:hypothetical protein
MNASGLRSAGRWLIIAGYLPLIGAGLLLLLA